jgi:hypothetical protein
VRQARQAIAASLAKIVSGFRAAEQAILHEQRLHDI